jgi:sugar phosphate isomerase/epimerase
MNNPNKPLIPQISHLGEMGFRFLDLTAEWPEATPEILIKKEKKVKDALSAAGMSVVGHTPWFFPYTHPYESVRRQALDELKRSFDALARFEAKSVSIHPDVLHFVYKNREQFLSHFFESIGELQDYADSLGIPLLFEAYDENSLSTEELKELFVRFPRLGFHLDVGHANLSKPKGARIFELIDLFGSRTKHVHVSDNDGSGDQHLPIGAGRIKWGEVCAALKRIGYDGTVTLEVFSQDLEYLKISKRKFEEFWNES